MSILLKKLQTVHLVELSNHYLLSTGRGLSHSAINHMKVDIKQY